MYFNELMKEFGASLGLGDFKADENGVFSLSVDGSVVSFVERSERGLLDIVARVCDVPAENADKVLKVLMTAMAPENTAADYSFFVLDEDNGIYLRRLERLADLDVEGVRQMLENFANALDEWRAAIGDFQSILPAVNEALDRSGGSVSPLGLGEGGFMQV